MSQHEFLFTYSVTPKEYTRECQALTTEVKKRIADICLPNWTRIDQVETAYLGELVLTAESVHGKRKEAIDIITSEIREIMSELGAYFEVYVDVALLVNRLGQCQQFIV